MSRQEVKELVEGMKNPIYPTADSLSEAIQRINGELGDVPRVQLLPLINLYHNTLLTHIQKALEEITHDGN